LHAGVDILLFERVLQRKRVDYGGQHTHVVGRNAVHVSCLIGHSAKEVSAADDNRHLDAELVHVGQFRRNFMNADSVDAEAFVSGQGLAGNFQQDAFEDRCRHEELV
jgi:hypothetical protein